MTRKAKKGFWRRCRIYFRRVRIAVWLVLLALVCAVIYLDRVGLPDFVKRPVLEHLHSRGLDLEFSRLRWRWHRGIVAENVRFGRANDLNAPQLSAREVALQINLDSLARFRFQVDGLVLRDGKLEWPDAPDAPLHVLNVSNIESTLRLLPDDEWSLDDFRARFAGTDFNLTAGVQHARDIRNWSVFHAARPTATNAWPQRLRQLATLLQRISFDSPPQLRLSAAGDARDPQSFSARITLIAPGVNTVWGNATQLLFSVKVAAATTNAPQRADVTLRAAAVKTYWGDADELSLTSGVTAETNLLTADPALFLWTNALPWQLNWQLGASGLAAKKISVAQLNCAGLWRAPELVVTNLVAKLGGGTLSATAGLDVLTREARFEMQSDVDPAAIRELLTPKTQRWLSKYSWHTQPHLVGSGAVTLPAWTNRHPDWRGEVRPTLRLAGQFAVTNGAYLDVHADWARSHFTYTNMVWHLPDLEVRRPEGTMFLAHTEDDRTKDYHWHLNGPVNPEALRPLLKTNQLRGFDLFTFNEPVVVEGDVWGRLYEHERIGFEGRVTATNFAVRGQSATWFESGVRYTNRFLEFFSPHLTRGAQIMNASGVAVDFPAQRIYFTNGFAMAEPQAVAEAIGPKVAHALEPYRFTIPPTVHVEGYAPLKGSHDADLRFGVDGGPFEWLKFRVPRLNGDVRWVDDTLSLSNVQADFYDGGARGHAKFKFFRPEPGAEFSFTLSVSNVELRSLLADLTTHSNRLEGKLSGSVTITDANSTNRQSWNGLGYVGLRDGFIWEIPMFGVFSPILDGILPGLGRSRASEGRAQFIITNSVIYSESVRIRSPMMRLNYSGSVDFDSRVDARVEAELLRDAWIVGRVISVVLSPFTKIFEYKVTGTLSKPKAEPVYIPKFLFLPFHPLRTMEDLFTGNPDGTNAPVEPDAIRPALPEAPPAFENPPAQSPATAPE